MANHVSAPINGGYQFDFHALDNSRSSLQQLVEIAGNYFYYINFIIAAVKSQVCRSYTHRKHTSLVLTGNITVLHLQET